MKKASIGVYIQMGTGVQTVSTLKEFIDIGVKLGYEKLYLGIGENFKVKNQPYLSRLWLLFCRAQRALCAIEPNCRATE